LNDRQQLSGWHTQCAANLRHASAGDDPRPLPVIDSGAGDAEQTCQRNDAASLGDQVIDGKLLHARIVDYADELRKVENSSTIADATAQTDAMTSLKAIGARVRELRLAENIGQEELAVVIGVSRSTIAGIETGGDRGGIETMIAIADHYKVPMDWLLDRTLPPGLPPVGKLVYRPDEIAVLTLWNNLPVQFKEAWRDMLAGVRLPEPTSTATPRRRVRRKTATSG